MTLAPMDPNLQERASVTGGTTSGVFYNGTDEDGDGEEDGVSVYSITPDDPDGDWRVIFTGEDASGPSVRRDHSYQRLIPVNRLKNLSSMIPFSFEKDSGDAPAFGDKVGRETGGSSKCYGIWIDTTRYLKQVKGQGGQTSTDYLDSISGQGSGPWSVLNGSYFNESKIPNEPIGAVASGGGWNYNYTPNFSGAGKRYFRRWSFGMNARYSGSSDLRVELDDWGVAGKLGYWAPSSLGSYNNGLDGIQALVQNGQPKVWHASGYDGDWTSSPSTTKAPYVDLPFQDWSAQGLYQGYTFSAIGITQNCKNLLLVADYRGSNVAGIRDLFLKSIGDGKTGGTYPLDVGRDYATPSTADNRTLDFYAATSLGGGVLKGKMDYIWQKMGRKKTLPPIWNAMLLDGGSASNLIYRQGKGRAASEKGVSTTRVLQTMIKVTPK